MVDRIGNEQSAVSNHTEESSPSSPKKYMSPRAASPPTIKNKLLITKEGCSIFLSGITNFKTVSLFQYFKC